MNIGSGYGNWQNGFGFDFDGSINVVGMLEMTEYVTKCAVGFLHKYESPDVC